MGEAFLGNYPFKPLVERSSHSTITAHVKNRRKLYFPHSRQGYGSPFLASYCGNNSGTDMLEQYGDFGTK